MNIRDQEHNKMHAQHPESKRVSPPENEYATDPDAQQHE